VSAGVAALVVLSAIARGAEQDVVDRVRALGTDLLTVSAAPAPPIAGRERQSAITTTLRAEDATFVAEESRLALRVAPGVSRNVVARGEGLNANATLAGTTVDGLRIRGVRASSGRLFDEDEDRERRRVAVLGPTVVRHLFGGTDPIGREIRIDRVSFDVIGVLARRGTDPGGSDLDNEIIVPLATATRRVLNIPHVHFLLVQGRRTSELEALEAEVRGILRQRHAERSGLADPLVYRNQAVLLRTERGAARAFSRLGIALAALATVVGCAGIAGIMLVSVRERTREIGLRRAVGAKRRDILRQFVLESSMVTLAGSFGGVMVGVMVATVAALLGAWTIVVPWETALLALVGSLLVGLVLGTVPALRASRLEPTTALGS
jgi:putative ABC transport system permease protein